MVSIHHNFARKQVLVTKKTVRNPKCTVHAEIHSDCADRYDPGPAAGLQMSPLCIRVSTSPVWWIDTTGRERGNFFPYIGTHRLLTTTVFLTGLSLYSQLIKSGAFQYLTESWVHGASPAPSAQITSGWKSGKRGIWRHHACTYTGVCVPVGMGVYMRACVPVCMCFCALTASPYSHHYYTN